MRYRHDLLNRWSPDHYEGFGSRTKYWCHSCDTGQKELRGIVHHRATYWEPEDGTSVCPSCGSQDISEDYDPKPARAIRRFKAWTKPNSERARLARGERMLPFEGAA